MGRRFILLALRSGRSARLVKSESPGLRNPTPRVFCVIFPSCAIYRYHSTGMPTEASDLEPGTITALKVQVKTPGRVSVFLDGSFAFGVNRDLVLEFGLKKGLPLSADEQRRILDRESEYRARSTALNYISYRSRTEKEVRRRLARDDYAGEVVDSVVEYLTQIGLLDDTTFAVAYAEGRFKTGGYGPRRVQYDLLRKGVARSAAEKAVDEVFSERDDVLATARDLAVRRWSRLAGEEDERKRRKKVYDYLIRRGYPNDIVRRILDELAT